MTKKEILCMATAAIRASKPMGLGLFHHQNKDSQITPAEVLKSGVFGGCPKRESLDIDYFNGRMVKFGARACGDVWSVTRGDSPRPDYQSWAMKYPTLEDLYLAGLYVADEMRDANGVE